VTLILTAGFLFVAASLAVILSQRTRGRLRTVLGSLFAYSAGAGAVGTLAAVALSAGWQQSNVLSFAGIVITVALTLVATESARGFRKLRIGIVIPSMRPFHRDLRRGIMDAVDVSRYKVIDPYNEGDYPEEDLSSFGPCLRSAIRSRADYLIVCAPAIELASSEDLQTECLRLVRRGGHIVFIESIPHADLLISLKFVSTLVSDSETGATLIAEFLQTFLESRPDLSEKPILIIPGPKHSRPARDRAASLLAALEGRPIAVRHTLTWTEQEARMLVLEALPTLGSVAAICCGNDDMAHGAAQAVAELGASVPAITGHDGLLRAIVAISDPFSPLAATVRIPPRAFGEQSYLRLDLVPPRWRLLLPGGFSRCTMDDGTHHTIVITRANLVTHNNAHLLID
jgi:ABC-type sugar transport system substrate-binding protein